MYITTQEFKKLTSENVSKRSAQTNVANKNGIANFIKNINSIIN